MRDIDNYRNYGNRPDAWCCPYIGPNGNWWINGVDTGKPSRGNDGLTPFIGPNGNWWLGTMDTRIPAQGNNGRDGMTPYIGPNGNWWIGTTDTRVPAQGREGRDGRTPFIGPNGNWFIGRIDTGVHAQGPAGPVGPIGQRGPRGDAGVDGDTPEIGNNGNWFIGGVDTGMPSRGEQGEPGPEVIKQGYFVTLNDPNITVPDNGLEILTGGRLPIKRLEVDTANLFVLNPTDNTIQFNQTGTYEVMFTVNAYVKRTNPAAFDPTTDFVSIGFRTVNGEIVFAGANTWTSEEVAINTVGIGVFVVTSIAEPFELVNLQEKSVYINGGKIEHVITDSYFSCPLVTLLIKKLV
ncbi:MAG: hypothetical protein Q4B48_01870 [Syntrophomonadaceae bacterium]|nr:hypothetical protein [Syntrophomonadaceae bacterium]